MDNCLPENIAMRGSLDFTHMVYSFTLTTQVFSLLSSTMQSLSMNLVFQH